MTLRKLFSVILILFPIIIVLKFALMIVFGARGLNKMAMEKLENRQTQAADAAIGILHERQFEPVIKLSEFNIPAQNMDIAGIGLAYNEISGIYYRNTQRYFSNIFSSAQAPEYIVKIGRAAETISDTLKFRPAFWNPEWQYGSGAVKIDEKTFQVTLIKKDIEVRMIVVDPENLKPLLKDLFTSAASGSDYQCAKIFDNSSDFMTQVQFLDDKDESFFSFGKEPDYPAWNRLKEVDYNSLGWKISVKIFPKESALLRSAEASDKTPWFPVIETVLAILCILALAYLTPKRKD